MSRTTSMDTRPRGIDDCPPVMKVAEVADFLRADLGTVYKLIHAGRLGHVEVGRSFRVTADQLQRFIEGH